MLQVVRPLRLAMVVLLVAACGCSVIDRVERAIPHRPPKGVDLNTATRDEIADLPGVSDVDAERIVQQRPYDSKEELLQRGVVSQETFEKLADRFYLSRPAPSRAASGPAGTSSAPKPPA